VDITAATSGTMSAGVAIMRTLLAVLLLGGCAGAGPAGSQGGSRIAVMPSLSELPSDPARRDAVLDSANATADETQRPGMTPKERKAETAAATAAAIIGSMFSTSPNATIGTASVFDENHVGPKPGPLHSTAADPPPPPPAPGDDAGTSNADLVPWIKLK
jgi:hypothetical protein